jgi:hypothetical protein
MTSKIKVDNITDQDDNNIINESGDVITVGASGDTVAVAGNIVKSNALQASDGGNIVSQSGTTITLGASGDTVSLASGASQSGFGRTGTVDWQTGSVKTATFTATSGEGYFCNTSGGAFQVNLPAGTAGSIVSVQDYNNSFDSNTLTVQVNGSQKINGGTASGKIELDTEGEGLTLVYVDDTVGWRSIHNSNFTDQSSNAVYVAATGGNATVTCGNFKTHIFTGPGTFCVSCAGNACGSNSVEYLVVAGGGGAAMGNSFDSGGGGGAGGFRSRTALPSASPLNAPANLSITASPFPISVGGGGAGNCSPCGSGSQGNTSTFSSITSAGGGKGEFGSPVCDSRGGSGGGIHQAAVAAGNFPPVAPPQGQPGGTSGPNCTCSPNGGGGGGAGAAGGNGSAPKGGNGGDGSFIPTGFVGPTAPSYGETGPAGRYFAGGGAGGMSPGRGGQTCGTGGLGGGGDSTQLGVANTGGGGGASDTSAPRGRNGGSGIVMIRYQYQGS